RRHIDLKSHWRDIPLEVHKERYSRSKLLFQNLQILFKVDFDQGFECLRMSSFARVLGFIKDSMEYKMKNVFQVGFKQFGPGVEKGFHRVQDENVFGLRWNCRELKGIVKLRFFRANITVTGVPGQEGADGNVAKKKKVRESMKANLRKLLKYKAWLTRRPGFEVPALDEDAEYRLCLSVTPKRGDDVGGGMRRRLVMRRWYGDDDEAGGGCDGCPEAVEGGDEVEMV
nr:hypothetical protein [Tanacetum cinerariifolium]